MPEYMVFAIKATRHALKRFKSMLLNHALNQSMFLRSNTNICLKVIKVPAHILYWDIQEMHDTKTNICQ